MPALHQIIAILDETKRRAGHLTDAYHGWKGGLLTGHRKLFEGVEISEGNETSTLELPNDNKRIQLKVPDVISEMLPALVDYWDITATQEKGNTVAVADIEIDGNILLQGIPVGTLLFLEKRMKEILTFCEAIPTNSTDRDWTWDKDTQTWKTAESSREHTTKKNVPIVLYEATDKHPAQVQLTMKDVRDGYWKETLLSGATSPGKKAKLIAKASKVLKSIKSARQKANAIEVEQVDIGQKLLDVVFGDFLTTE